MSKQQVLDGAACMILTCFVLWICYGLIYFLGWKLIPIIFAMAALMWALKRLEDWL